MSNDTENIPKYSPLWQLVMARLREFYREPEAIFWVYGFPILMVIALGIAFRNKPVEQFSVDVEQGLLVEHVKNKLAANPTFRVHVADAETARHRLRTGRTDVIIVPLPKTGGDRPTTYEYVFDPTRTESALAKFRVNDALQYAEGRKEAVPTGEQIYDEKGGRYIDFLVPGLLAMSLMGGGLWGVGFVIVDMRLRKVLKRFLATPMNRSDFLAGIMISRLAFMVPEVVILLIFSWLAFGVVIQGRIFNVIALILLGAFTFSGLGLLVASRAKTIEAVSGLMNLVMLPMWVLSGIFFSSERFPEVAQPVIKALPLTPLIDSLRAVMLEGDPLTTPEQLTRVAILAGYGVVTFILALKIFRWN